MCTIYVFTRPISVAGAAGSAHMLVVHWATTWSSKMSKDLIKRIQRQQSGRRQRHSQDEIRVVLLQPTLYDNGGHVKVRICNGFYKMIVLARGKKKRKETGRARSGVLSI